MKRTEGKIERVASEIGGYIKITYIVVGYRMCNEEIAAWLRDTYKIPEKEIKERILEIGRELIEKYSIDNRDLKEALESNEKYYNIWVNKENKTSREIKEEIKTIDKVVSELIVRAVEEAMKIKKRIDVSDWLWKEAVFDWNKAKFVPAKENSDDC